MKQISVVVLESVDLNLFLLKISELYSQHDWIVLSCFAPFVLFGCFYFYFCGGCVSLQMF